MAHVGIGNNLFQPNKQCLKCKRWKSAEKSNFFMGMDFARSGYCSLGYCEKQFKGKRKKK